MQAIWLRTFGGTVQVLVEVEGKERHEWRVVIEHPLEFYGTVSHIWEGRDLENRPLDSLTKGTGRPL